MTTLKEDICNICNKTFIKDINGNWINHRHKLKNNND